MLRLCRMSFNSLRVNTKEMCCKRNNVGLTISICPNYDYGSSCLSHKHKMYLEDELLEEEKD